MTDITNTEYEDALNIVAQKERALLDSASKHVEAASAALKEATERLSDTISNLPKVVGSQSVSRSNIESAFNQIQSYYSQVQYLTDTFNNLKAQYEVSVDTAE